MTITDSPSAKTAPAFICLSRSETQALCLKAARGKGMSWGLAEEAGFAAGWLIAHGIDGAGLLLRYLTSVNGGAFDDLRPMPQGRYWRAMPNRLLCPIGLGAALLDRARLANGPFSAPLHTDSVSDPILLAPFLAEASRHSTGAILLKWNSHSAAFALGGPCDKVYLSLPAVTVAALELTRTQDDFRLAHPSFGCMVASDTIAALEAYAMRTAVPATEISRRGAGSDSADDD